MSYSQPFILVKDVGNNSFSYEERKRKYGIDPSITIPMLQYGILNDVKIGEEIVFEEIEDGILKSCRGLKHFVRLNRSVIARNEAIQVQKIPSTGSPHSASQHLRGQEQHITIFDNHNHALYFWIEAIHEGKIKPGFELIHIDEHSDLWPNAFHLDSEQALNDLEYVWEFTNFSCNVGNYIAPAKECGIIGNMIRIENDFQVDAYMDYKPGENSVLNIDLDFFAPEMDFIDDEKKYRLIRHLISKVSCITIATSPFFIDQKRALEALFKIFD